MIRKYLKELRGQLKLSPEQAEIWEKYYSTSLPEEPFKTFITEDELNTYLKTKEGEASKALNEMKLKERQAKVTGTIAQLTENEKLQTFLWNQLAPTFTGDETPSEITKAVNKYAKENGLVLTPPTEKGSTPEIKQVSPGSSIAPAPVVAPQTGKEEIVTISI